MDAPDDDGDLRLQRVSADLLDDLQRSLHPFLWKKTTSGKTRIRQRVRARETDRLISLLEPFQELPQLLDPHLGQLVPALADAFLASLRSRSGLKPPTHPHLLIPLSSAISRLLYTFCKIRGEKVVVRFLSTEMKHLELLLSALEIGNRQEDAHPESRAAWGWEERYTTLLWLSQLLLAPFDLATISSAGTASAVKPDVPGLVWPSDIPSVTLRIVPICIYYLQSAGKERDAARVLLVRVSLRKDMQDIGILDSLVHWALFCLRPSNVEHSSYYYIGILSFLAGILHSSSSTADMNPYLSQISQAIQGISSSDEASFKQIRTSAVARKSIIKVFRTTAVLLLRSASNMASAEMVESGIGHMLESLADSATPVRLAASKALSIITLKLAPDMAVQVVQAVLDSLKQNVLWSQSDSGPRRDLSGVNPSEWHGLILTLSHLLYRRSPPAHILSDILPALLTGLIFEQRSTSGSSVGTNVRDAACFGIWALARRYTTEELLAIPVSMSSKDRDHPSTIQILATQLVISASLDPAGNIRRGSSAALQELIGRHPNTIIEGIQVVQIVDYHAVALRSRAMKEVGYQAAQLSEFYMDGLLDALLGWRGIGDAGPSIRRNAADSVGMLIWAQYSSIPSQSWRQLSFSLDRIGKQMKVLEKRQVDERHGLLLSLASVMEHMRRSFDEKSIFVEHANPSGLAGFIAISIQLVTGILGVIQSTAYRRPELIAEATSRLITAMLTLLQVDVVLRGLEMSPTEENFNEVQLALVKLLRGAITHHTTHPSHLVDLIGNIQIARRAGFVPNEKLLAQATMLISSWLRRNESEVINPASEAAADVLLLLDENTRSSAIQDWITAISEPPGSRSGQDRGVINTLLRVFPITESLQNSISVALHKRWNLGHDIESRAAILNSLTRGSILDTHPEIFVDMVSEGLDDYTTNARGDVGSLVRIEAVRATALVWKNGSSVNAARLSIFNHLLGKVLRLTVERLDKVRMEAQQTTASLIIPRYDTIKFSKLSTSSIEYFNFLLEMQTNNCLLIGPYEHKWSIEMLEGYVSSADTGSEDLIRNSRAALVAFCETGNINLICETLLEVLEKNISNDRILVPTMEAIGFLFDAQIMQRSSLNMLLHPFPKIRNQAAEELFVAKGVGKGVNWAKAGKAEVETLKDALELHHSAFNAPKEVRKAINDSFQGTFRTLKRLDQEMAKNDFLYAFAPINVVTVGGFLAVSYFKNRETTGDLDYMIDPQWAQDDEIKSPLKDAIDLVAQEEKFESEWMNDGLQIWATTAASETIFARAYEQNILLFDGKSLRVWAAPFEWALERKLRRIAYSKRGSKKGDMGDALALFKHFREANGGPLDMEYFQNLNMNGFDMAPEPNHMEKVATEYRDVYKEDLFSSSSYPGSDNNKAYAVRAQHLVEAPSTGTTAQESTQSPYITSNSIPIELIVKSKSNRDGSTYYRCARDGAKDIEVKEEDWIYTERQGCYSYTDKSGTQYYTWTLDVKGKGTEETKGGSKKHRKK
ncbi:hypothetical protein B7494_g6343 [Chlorociboria aeruginascens]|nr:hypothetical protein B7494_g6343 [Chlorociboria aeruginascens]